MFSLATRRRHKFGEAKSVPPNAALQRYAQTERTCEACGVVKVTVHAPDGGGWREWRLEEKGEQRVRDEPVCVPVEVKEQA